MPVIKRGQNSRNPRLAAQKPITTTVTLASPVAVTAATPAVAPVPAGNDLYNDSRFIDMVTHIITTNSKKEEHHASKPASKATATKVAQLPIPVARVKKTICSVLDNRNEETIKEVNRLKEERKEYRAKLKADGADADAIKKDEKIKQITAQLAEIQKKDPMPRTGILASAIHSKAIGWIINDTLNYVCSQLVNSDTHVATPDLLHMQEYADRLSYIFLSLCPSYLYWSPNDEVEWKAQHKDECAKAKQESEERRKQLAEHIAAGKLDFLENGKEEESDEDDMGYGYMSYITSEAKRIKQTNVMYYAVKFSTRFKMYFSVLLQEFTTAVATAAINSNKTKTLSKKHIENVYHTLTTMAQCDESFSGQFFNAIRNATDKFQSYKVEMLKQNYDNLPTEKKQEIELKKAQEKRESTIQRADKLAARIAAEQKKLAELEDEKKKFAAEATTAMTPVIA